jgi:hypothetical protein
MIIRHGFLFCGLIFAALPAFADQVSFSYTFATGNSVFGTVDGDLQSDRNTILHLHNLQAIYSGSPGTSLIFTTSFFDALKLDAIGIHFGGFNGTTTGLSHSDFGFLFIDDGFPCPNCATVGNFDTGSSQIMAPFGANQFEAEAIDRSRWSAALVGVPEPTDLFPIGMLIGAIGLLARHRSC